jgi:lipoprotein-anchoring transpeptidase ErfK/SrfK
VSDTVRARAIVVASLGAVLLAAPAPAAARPTATAARPAGEQQSLTLVIDHGAKVAIRRAPAGRSAAVARWKTSFGSVRRLRVVERRGNWFAVESDVLGNGVVGWVPRTAAVRLRRVRYSLEADLSQRLLTLRESGRIVFRRRVSIGAGASPTPSGRFHVSDQISGIRWRLGCCIVVLSGTQPRLPAGWNGGDRLAIHGRASTSESIGAPTSAGCLHATEQTLRDLARLPLGTPVVIHP